MKNLKPQGILATSSSPAAEPGKRGRGRPWGSVTKKPNAAHSRRPRGIRRTEPDAESKYIAIKGGAATSFMVLGDARATVVVEAELDALLLYQEAGDLATMMATGSAQYKPDAEVFGRLKAAPVLLVALDAEKSGYAAWKWWRDNLPNARFCPVPVGKDPTEAHQQRADLRAWVGGLVPDGHHQH